MDAATFWDKSAAKYVKTKISDMPAYIETRDRMRRVLQPHHRVLELGCGSGSTAMELADGVDQYVATDVSPRMIALAKEKHATNRPDNLRFEVRDAGQLVTGQQDVVIALNLLHLVPDLEALLAQIYAGLPSGGIVIAKTGLLGDAPFFLHWVIAAMRAVGKAPYVRSLRGPELQDLLRKAGFNVTDTLTQKGLVPRVFTVARKP